MLRRRGARALASSASGWPSLCWPPRWRRLVASWPASRAISASAQINPTLLLDAIAAAVIGGVSLFGGRGSVWAVVLGSLIIGSLENGLDLLNQGTDVKLMVEGVVLLIAVTADAVIRRRNAASGLANIVHCGAAPGIFSWRFVVYSKEWWVSSVILTAIADSGRNPGLWACRVCLSCAADCLRRRYGGCGYRHRQPRAAGARTTRLSHGAGPVLRRCALCRPHSD